MRFVWDDSCKWLDKKDKEEIKKLIKKEREEYDTFSYYIPWKPYTIYTEIYYGKNSNGWKVSIK